MSSNDELISLREKSSAILSLLTVVASRPADAVEIHKDVTLCGLLPDFNGEHNNCDVGTFYTFLKSEFLRDKKYSNINHLDALLRCPGILRFFHENLGLHEAWILFVDIKGNVEQLWLKDRANSVVFPEKDRDINEKRIKALEARNGDDKTFLDTAKPEKIVTVGDDLLKKHLYREWLARFLLEKNKAQFAGSTVSGGSLLKLIPAFNFLGTKDEIKKRRNIEQKNLILLSTPKEYWDGIGKKRSDNADTCYPFDAFVLDALFAHESSAPDDDSKLLFFSFPLDPVDLTKNGNTREHGALWSGFLLVTKAEAALLESEKQAISNGDYAKLIWRIRTLRSALNILGQPCVRTQLEKQARRSEAEKVRAAMFKKEHSEKKRLKEAVTGIDEAVRSVEARVRFVRNFLDFDMGQHLTDWWHVLETIFQNTGSVRECGCLPVPSNHSPNKKSNAWQELMAAGLLRFVLAHPCLSSEKATHAKRLQQCMDSLSDASPLCSIHLFRVLKRLNILTAQNGIAQNAYDHLVYGWKAGIKDYISKEILTIAMIEWAIGANLSITKYDKTRGIKIDTDTRQIILGGIHDLFVSLCDRYDGEEANLLSCHIRMTSKINTEQLKFCLCLSPLTIIAHDSSVTSKEIIDQNGALKLFRSADSNEDPNSSTRTTTWGLLRSLGCNPESSDNQLNLEGNKLVAREASAYWDNGLWISYG